MFALRHMLRIASLRHRRSAGVVGEIDEVEMRVVFEPSTRSLGDEDGKRTYAAIKFI